MADPITIQEELDSRAYRKLDNYVCEQLAGMAQLFNDLPRTWNLNITLLDNSGHTFEINGSNFYQQLRDFMTKRHFDTWRRREMRALMEKLK